MFLQRHHANNKPQNFFHPKLIHIVFLISSIKIQEQTIITIPNSAINDDGSLLYFPFGNTSNTTVLGFYFSLYFTIAGLVHRLVTLVTLPSLLLIVVQAH